MMGNVQKRAQYGLKTIEAYRALIGRERGVVDEDTVTDMLTDVWHMCHSLDIDFHTCHSAALLHFCAEKEGAQ
jgi:hypothetical protein